MSLICTQLASRSIKHMEESYWWVASPAFHFMGVCGLTNTKYQYVFCNKSICTLLYAIGYCINTFTFLVTNPFVHYCTTLLFQYIFCNKNYVKILNQNASSVKEHKLLYSYLLTCIVIKELFVTMSLYVLSTLKFARWKK